MREPNHSELLESAWKALPAELLTELHNILNYWQRYTTDPVRGGFVGRINSDNQVDDQAPRGAVLNSRILWTFSAAYGYTKNPQHLELATRAFDYIRGHLTDDEFGGLYWSVDFRGWPLTDHKLVYAQAFGIYAMSEYYRVSKAPEALEKAQAWYKLIELYSRDRKHGGYVDAFERDWSFLADKRLSPKDENASKTMNTHLHLAEAYANLYEVWPDVTLKQDLLELLRIFDEKIINPSGHHLELYFNDEWVTDHGIISYGHDIEAAWLLQSCAESLQDVPSIETAKKNALRITEAAMEGLDEDGGLWYEWNNHSGELTREKHWWPQAEALIGFCNAWQLTQDAHYKSLILKNWQFIRDNILDTAYGEWLWGLDQFNKPLPGQDKAGLWKCPYHNSRACLQLLARLKAQDARRKA